MISVTSGFAAACLAFAAAGLTAILGLAAACRDFAAACPPAAAVSSPCIPTGLRRRALLSHQALLS